MPNDKKLKLVELENLFEEQKKYCYITQEMVILSAQLDKAKQWQQRVESLRTMTSMHYKLIDSIY